MSPGLICLRLPAEAVVLTIALFIFSQRVPIAAADPPATVNSPLSPEESLKHFQIEPELTIELVAAEPQIVDPVSIAFDEDGRLYVVEMRDYPTGPQPGRPPLSQIKLLEDLDQDGRYETAYLFADKLLFATGVQPWQGGVIVTLAGEIAYFKDTDGDHMADLRETWFRGFVEQNPQLRANHPTFGPDNHIYVANGLRGGTIVANEKKWGRKYEPVSISGKDFRFDPLTGACEAVAGNGQFGMTFDDLGNRFICDNRHPCRQVMLEDRYTRRNPFLAIREVVHDVCAPAEFSKIHPISRAWTTSNLHAGQFTAACGVLIYRGDELPQSYARNIFVCDPTGNLVHREIAEPGRAGVAGESAAAFYGKPADPEREFLATADEWFRPVDLANGPDGALYVVDMYRAVIEHPEWVPDELKHRPDAWLGNDLGRIYRVVRTGHQAFAAPRLSQQSPRELVGSLEDSNGWVRDQVARLLFERQDKSVVSLLQQLTETPAVARGNFLQVLDGLGGLTDEILARSVAEFNAAGLVLAEPRLKKLPVESPLYQLLVPPRLDNAPLESQPRRFRFQKALSLGELPDSPGKQLALAQAALIGARDEWLRKGVLTSAGDRPDLLFREIVGHKVFADSAGRITGREGFPLLLRELTEMIGARSDPGEFIPVLATLVTLREFDRGQNKQPVQQLTLAGWNGLGQGLVRRGDSLSAMLDRIEEREEGVRAAIKPLFDDALALAVDRSIPPDLTLEAIAALQHVGFAVAGETLLQLATTDPDQAFRLRAIDVLATYRAPEIADLLLAGFATQTPAVRRALLQALLRDGERTRRLLVEIDAKRIAPTELDPLTVQALLNHKVPATRDEAKLVLAALVPADRKVVLDQYQRALTLDADAKRGKLIFEKQCAACHRIGGVGVDVAPDISDSRTRTPAQLLTDILNPNQAIDNNYVSYTVVTNDGKAESGVISAETPASITLRQPEGKVVLILRQDIDILRSNGISLMPDGLEKNMTVEQLADLISYIKNWRYLDGAVPAAR